MTTIDYKSSGVDRALADQLVDDVAGEIAKSRRAEVVGGLGDFGGFFRAPENYKKPLFVATTDGVGTKLLLAIESQQLSGLGQDLVAMCVNDLIACRAEPLIFLDYFATGKLSGNDWKVLVTGINRACQDSGCSLIGGETAEMPGFYAPRHFDLAGFAVGVVEADQRFDPLSVKEGDLIIGFASSGFHSNGYSLIRKIVSDQRWSLDLDFEGAPLAEHLLRPTELYPQKLLSLLRRPSVKAGCHITGGGLIENLPRGWKSENLQAVVDSSCWELPSFMQRFVEAAAIEKREAYSTWNMGLGFCMIVDPSDESPFTKAGGRVVGEMRKRSPADPEVIVE
jgi:phosphoribosylformylglycinamidine cyclo-ligase